MTIDRVVPSLSFRNFLDDLGQLRKRQDQTSSQISSGRRINNPSDDPSGLSELLRLRDNIASVEQFSINATRARSLLGFTDTVLGSVFNLLNVALEKGISGANSTRSPQDRAALANEVDNIKAQIVGLANSTFEGNFIFAGQRVTSQPFSLDPAAPGGVRYDGDSGISQVELTASLRIPVNAPGNQVFTAAGGNVFVALQNLIDGLRSNDLPGIGAAVTQVSSASNQVKNARTINGTTLATVERVLPILDNEKLNYTTRAAAIGDANLAEAISNFVQGQAAENATLGIGARLSRRSLFDVIG